jgi:hypothetical protein
MDMMKLFKAQRISFPEYYKEYSLGQLENCADYSKRAMTRSQRFRLVSLGKALKKEGLLYPIIISWDGYRVRVGHQRVWWAKQLGYSHISCYHIPNQATQDMIMKTDYSDDYWKNLS